MYTCELAAAFAALASSAALGAGPDLVPYVSSHLLQRTSNQSVQRIAGITASAEC